MEVTGLENHGEKIFECLCRLCGSQGGRMLHLTDTYSIMDNSDSIMNLLLNISVILKVKEDEEDLMSKHVCFSCFNIAVDVQAFVDSSINFQKTIINQLSTERVREKDLQIVSHNHNGVKRIEQDYARKEENKKIDTALHVIECNTTENFQTKPSAKAAEVPVGYKLTTESDQSNWLETTKSCEESTSQILTESESNTTNENEVSDAPHHCKENQDLSQSTSSEVKQISHHFPDQPSTESSVKVSNNHEGNMKDKTQLLENANTAKADNEKSTADKKDPKKCHICSKTFPRQSQLKSHLLSHSGMRPFECPTCHMKFKYRRNLVEHTSIHNEVPSYICSKCGLTFKQRSNLLKHERIHQDKTSYKCSQCNNTYSQSSHLKTHINNVHSDNKGYKCNLCDATVLCKSSLKRHMRTVHDDSTKFMCPHCNKGFNNSQNYQGHLRRHSGERPYSCLTCAKTFTTTKALSRHRIIHQPNKSHKCTQCSKAFHELCDLKKHVKRHLLKQAKKMSKSATTKQQVPVHSTATQVVAGMGSLNLMVLTDSLIFSESQQLLDPTASRVTEVLLPGAKIDATKDNTAQPLLEQSSAIQSSSPSLPQPSLALTKIGEEVLAPSPLLPSTPMLSTTQDVEAITILADTAVLQPPESNATVPAAIGPSRVLQSTDIQVQEVLSRDEDNVTLAVQEPSDCNDAPTMVVLSSVGAPPEYLPVTEQASQSTVIDSSRHQQGQRVLSHATW